MKNLPDRPNIEHLKCQAKRLQRAYRDADPAAFASVRHYDSAFGVVADEDLTEAAFSVLDAQRIVAREHGFRSWPALARYVDRTRAEPSGKDRELAARLIALRDANVAAIESLKGEPRERYFRELSELQERDADILAETFDRHGWPTVDEFGHSAVTATFTTVGNLFTQGPLNRLAIEHLGVRVEDGEAPAGWLALLVDRADLLSGHRVRYGVVGDVDMQGRISMGNDVVDPANLDRRRATVGYEPIAEARRQWFEHAAREHLPVERDRASYYREIDETAAIGHWR